MNRWLTLLSLFAILTIALACSSGEDFSNGRLSPSTDVFNDPLPASFDDQFKPVGGGEFEIYDSYQSAGYNDFEGNVIAHTATIFDSLLRYEDYDTDEEPTLHSQQADLGNEETGDGSGDSENIDSFLMMKTEVTVEMFVDFLNSIAFKQDELTNAGEGETTSFTNPEFIYKPVMQTELSCGIYRFEFGERANDEITQQSGVAIPETVSGKPTYSMDEDGFIDPYVFIQNQKPRFASENQSSSFEVAPGREEFPMVYVNQEEAKEFCRWLGAQYRLPTWQEWQWAAQGGTAEYQFPTSDGNLFLNGLKVANFQYNSGTSTPTRKVATTGPPNIFGLFDLAGNVYEWTYFKTEDQSEGGTNPYGDEKFVMGGSFKTVDPSLLATWFRFGLFSSTSWTDDLGFRVIFDLTRGNSIADFE